MHLFRRIPNEIEKIPVHAVPCLSVRLSTCNNFRTAERIFIKFDIGEFYLNLLTFFLKLGSNEGYFTRSSACVSYVTLENPQPNTLISSRQIAALKKAVTSNKLANNYVAWL